MQLHSLCCLHYQYQSMYRLLTSCNILISTVAYFLILLPFYFYHFSIHDMLLSTCISQIQKIDLYINIDHHVWQSLDPILNIQSNFVKKKRKSKYLLFFRSFSFASGNPSDYTSNNLSGYTSSYLSCYSSSYPYMYWSRYLSGNPSCNPHVQCLLSSYPYGYIC